MNGTYRIDMHSVDGSVTFYYLDGTVTQIQGAERRTVEYNRRKEAGITEDAPKYYQIPFDVLKQDLFDNLIAVGRMINADKMAFGALRVMVNLNQLGEAAGTAAYVSVDSNQSLSCIDGKDVCRFLIKGGSVL